jgi:hypothetical protein
LLVIDVQDGLISGFVADGAETLLVDVDLVADRHTTSDNGLLSRPQIVARHDQTLANPAPIRVSVRVLPSADVAFGSLSPAGVE